MFILILILNVVPNDISSIQKSVFQLLLKSAEIQGDTYKWSFEINLFKA